MKKFLVSLALATTAMVAAAPASAQYYQDRGYQDRVDNRDWRGDRGEDLQPRLNRINMQISRGLDRGNLTPREAQQLRGEMNSIWAQARGFYRTGGYDYRERTILDRRIDRLQDRLQYERRDDDRRGRRY